MYNCVCGLVLFAIVQNCNDSSIKVIGILHQLLFYVNKFRNESIYLWVLLTHLSRSHHQTPPSLFEEGVPK